MAGKRSIFEEVGQGEKPSVAAPGAIGRTARGARGGVRLWLMVLFALVVLMIVVGGLTRLTDAGLSITEWKPLSGVVPPMGDADWQAEFAAYRESPEYQLQNKGMTLDAFKAIYWWEWSHRLLGRVIGVVWAAGFAGFALARRLPPGWAPRLWLVGALGGLQGVIGWWMVSSGLEGARVDVQSYRLAVHLGLAFVILGVLASYVLLLGRSEAELLQARRVREDGLKHLATWLAALAFAQILLGALVAGIDAGRGFPTWPLMNGRFFPADAFYVPDRPAWAAFFENAGLVQFIHRMTGYAVLGFGLYVWWRGRGSAHLATRRAFGLVALMLLAQVALGVVTVLEAAALPVALAHQLGAVVLWVAILRARHLSLYPRAGSIREGTA